MEQAVADYAPTDDMNECCWEWDIPGYRFWLDIRVIDGRIQTLAGPTEATEELEWDDPIGAFRYIAKRIETALANK